MNPQLRFAAPATPRLLLVFGTLGLLLLAGCETSQAVPTQPGVTAKDLQAAAVRIVPATQRSLRRSLELGGVAQAWRSANLVPVGQGVVRRLPVGIGDRVKKGALLAELDTATLQLQLEQTRMGLELGSLQLADAERETERARALKASGSIPSATLDKAESGLLMARAQVAQGEAALAVLVDQVRQARLIAPFAGTVTAVMLEEGEFFVPMAGMGGAPALVALQALDPLKIDLHVPDVDLHLIEVGMTAIVRTESMPGREFVGQVALVGAGADQGARTFLVRVKVPNPDRELRPGVFATASIVLEQRDDVIVVPDSALDTSGGGPVVMVLEGDKATRQPVTVGLRGDDGLEVTGIAAGAQILVEGHFGLPDGSAVRVIK